jgi:hypothetical protein
MANENRVKLIGLLHAELIAGNMLRERAPMEAEKLFERLEVGDVSPEEIMRSPTLTDYVLSAGLQALKDEAEADEAERDFEAMVLDAPASSRRQAQAEWDKAHPELAEAVEAMQDEDAAE